MRRAALDLFGSVSFLEFCRYFMDVLAPIFCFCFATSLAVVFFLCLLTLAVVSTFLLSFARFL